MSLLALLEENDARSPGSVFGRCRDTCSISYKNQRSRERDGRITGAQAKEFRVSLNGSVTKMEEKQLKSLDVEKELRRMEQECRVLPVEKDHL